MMNNAVLMAPVDDVATVTALIAPGERVSCTREGETVTVKAQNEIPQYHKIALRDIPAGNPVLKYGERIGYASAAIGAGEHVHTHNLTSRLKGVKV